jgi:hypothetical protein
MQNSLLRSLNLLTNQISIKNSSTAQKFWARTNAGFHYPQSQTPHKPNTHQTLLNHPAHLKEILPSPIQSSLISRLKLLTNIRCVIFINTQSRVRLPAISDSLNRIFTENSSTKTVSKGFKGKKEFQRV